MPRLPLLQRSAPPRWLAHHAHLPTIDPPTPSCPPPLRAATLDIPHPKPSPTMPRNTRCHATLLPLCKAPTNYTVTPPQCPSPQWGLDKSVLRQIWEVVAGNAGGSACFWMGLESGDGELWLIFSPGSGGGRMWRCVLVAGGRQRGMCVCVLALGGTQDHPPVLTHPSITPPSPPSTLSNQLYSNSLLPINCAPSHSY